MFRELVVENVQKVCSKVSIPEVISRKLAFKMTLK